MRAVIATKSEQTITVNNIATVKEGGCSGGIGQEFTDFSTLMIDASRCYAFVGTETVIVAGKDIEYIQFD